MILLTCYSVTQHSFCFVLLFCIYTLLSIFLSFFFVSFSLYLLFVVYSHMSCIVSWKSLLLSFSLSFSLKHEINSTLVFPFCFVLSSFFVVFVQSLFLRARGHTRATHPRTRSQSLANDMACPTVINHLSSRYRRISCVVSMRLQGSPPFLPLLPSAPC